MDYNSSINRQIVSDKNLDSVVMVADSTSSFKVGAALTTDYILNSLYINALPYPVTRRQEINVGSQFTFVNVLWFSTGFPNINIDPTLYLGATGMGYHVFIRDAVGSLYVNNGPVDLSSMFTLNTLGNHNPGWIECSYKTLNPTASVTTFTNQGAGHLASEEKVIDLVEYADCLICGRQSVLKFGFDEYKLFCVDHGWMDYYVSKPKHMLSSYTLESMSNGRFIFNDHLEDAQNRVNNKLKLCVQPDFKSSLDVDDIVRAGLQLSNAVAVDVIALKDSVCDFLTIVRKSKRIDYMTLYKGEVNIIFDSAGNIYSTSGSYSDAKVFGDVLLQFTQAGQRFSQLVDKHETILYTKTGLVLKIPSSLIGTNLVLTQSAPIGNIGYHIPIENVESEQSVSNDD